MNLKEKYIDKSKYDLKCPYEMKPEYITIHNTGNKASASAEVSYMQGNSSSTSFHIAVDDVEAIIAIPLNRNAWHAGDGNGTGNRKSIGIEICYSTGDEEKFRKAELHAIEVVKYLMNKFNIPIENVKSHRQWSGKNCPHKTDMGWFISQLKKGITTTQSTSITTSPQTKKIKMLINDKEVEVEVVVINGNNFVKLQCLRTEDIQIGYDSTKKMPKISTKEDK